MPKLLVTLPDGRVIAHDLTDPVVTVGRLEDNTIPVEDPSVSGRHAQLTLQTGGDHQLRDLDTTNGTRVNGKRVTEEILLRPGDRVRFGKVEAVYGSETLASEPDAAALALAPKVFLPPVAAIAEHSRRPAGFAHVTLARKKPRERPRDPVGRTLLALTGLAFLLFLVALFFLYRFQPPPAGLPT